MLVWSYRSDTLRKMLLTLRKAAAMRFCLCPRRTPFNQNQEYRFLLRLSGWTVKLVPASQFLTDRPPPRKGSPHIGRICARRNIFPMPLTHRKVLLTGYFPRKKKRTAENNHQHGSKMPFLHFAPFPRHAWRRRAANADAERGGMAMYQPG